MAMNLNYVQGVASGTKESDNGQYNLLIQGGSDYKQSSGLFLANDLRSNRGAQLMFANNGNTFMDFNAAATNAMNFRYTANGVTYNNMLQLMTEDAGNATRYVANINGRVKASQYVVDSSYNESRTILADKGALYMGQNNTGSYFIMNPNGKTGDFNFKVTNADGTDKTTVMSMRSNGQIQSMFYNKTTNADDSELTAVAGFDANGNLVRHFPINARIRTVETAVSTIAASVGSGLTNKVNEVINRLNSLNFYSINIKTYQIPPQVFTPQVASITSTSANVSFPAVVTTVAQSGDVIYNATFCDAQSNQCERGGNSAANTPFIIVTGLTSGRSYMVYVKATNDSGTSILSNGVVYLSP
jgi:hypothetical protein